MKEEVERETSSGTTHHLNVKTNITKQFLHFLDKHFGRNHKYHEIFNRNNVKISYSCMDDMKNIISSHNKKEINSDNEKNGKTSNCRNKSKCPLDNKCLTNKIIYKAQVKTNDGINELSTKIYFGIARQNLNPGTATIQCHLETGHTKMNFRNIFGV